MRKIFGITLGLFLLASNAYSTTSTINPNIPASGAPLSSAPIRANFLAAYTDINNLYTLISVSGAPGGSVGQLQYNAGDGAFGGLSLNGDCTLVYTTGVISCTKTAGVSFAPSATTNALNASNISSGSLALARIAAIANNTALGNVSGISAIPSALTATQLTTLVNSFTSSLSGAAPASGGGTVNFLRADGTWQAPPGGGGGSVNSVSMTGDGTIFNSTVSGSPITSSGTLAPALLTQTANKVLSGPTTGSAAAPTFRSLVGADLPNPGASSLGGVNSKASVSNNFLTQIGTDGSVSQAQPAFTNISGSVAATQMPALTGDVTSSAGAVATTVAKIQGVTVSGTTGTGNVAFSNSPTFAGNLNGAAATWSGIDSASKFVPTSAVPGTDSLFLPLTHTPGISANSLLVADFSSQGTGGDSWNLQNVQSSGLGSIVSPGAATAALAGAGAGNLFAGAYKYKITFLSTLGETAVGTVSNTVTVVNSGTDGQITLTGIPTSPNGTVTARNIYRTFAGGSDFYFDHQIPDNTTTTYTDNNGSGSLTYSAPTGQGQFPVYIPINAVAGNGDTSVGMQFNTIGTTTTGLQYPNDYGTGKNTSGTFDFNVNGVLQMRITDNLASLNNFYPGATNGYLMMGGGWGTTETSTAITAWSDTEPYSSLRLAGKGAFGMIHLINNGYAQLSVGGGPRDAGTDAQLACGWDIRGTPTSYGANGPDINTGCTDSPPSSVTGRFINDGAMGFNFFADSAASELLHLDRIANAVNVVHIQGAPSGSNPVISSGGGAGNIRLTLSGGDDAGVDIANRSGAWALAKFSGGFQPKDYLNVTAGTTAGDGVIMSVGSTGVNSPLIASSLGTGSVILKSNNAGTTLATFANSGDAALNVSGATFTSGAFDVTGTTVPSDGIYLPTGGPAIAANSIRVAQFLPTLSAVNYDTLKNSSTGNGVTWATAGSDSNINRIYNTKGASSAHTIQVNASPVASFTSTGLNNTVIGATTAAALTATTIAGTTITGQSLNVTGSTPPANGPYLVTTNTVAIAANSLPVEKFLPIASAVNWETLSGSATGSAVKYLTDGSDSSISRIYDVKGDSAIHNFKVNGATVVAMQGAAADTTSFQLSGGVNTSSLSAQGGTNPTLNIYTPGTGGIALYADNTVTKLLNLVRTASNGDYLSVVEQTAGQGVQLTTSTPGTNAPITVQGAGTGAVQLNGAIISGNGGLTGPGTPTTCGTGSPSVVGTNTRGTITTGTAATACTLPWGTTLSSAPFCVVSDDSLVGFASVTSTSTTNMIIGISSALSGAKITYHCIQ